MISKPAQPDHIDQLLNKYLLEAEIQEQQLATFLQRAIARFVDTAIVLAVSYGVQQLFVSFIIKDNSYNIAFLTKSVEQAMPAFALILWALIYSPLLEGYGGTIGKRLMRIQLVDLKTRKIPDFRMCTARSWIYLVFVILSFVPATVKGLEVLAIIGPAVLSCLAFFVSDYHQTWHDKITGIICVKKK
ncbi:MAG: RDD family protein [Chitinophagales bacterium]|nr:RDD family protein [Chitinophagales bacterium]